LFVSLFFDLSLLSFTSVVPVCMEHVRFCDMNFKYTNKEGKRVKGNFKYEEIWYIYKYLNRVKGKSDNKRIPHEMSYSLYILV
jgi:hypothetical protein